MANSGNAADGGGQFHSYYADVTDKVEWANIRSGPSMDFAVLRWAIRGLPLLVLERQKEWSMVEDFRNRKGWIANSLLADHKSVILKSNNEKLLQGPNLEDGIVKGLDYGTVMRIETAQGDWLKVVTREGIEGWLRKESVWPE